MKKLRKALTLTDIHWGKKNNSQQHNDDCRDFILWVCNLVKEDPSIDHIIFMGDWFENRSSINIATLKNAYQGAKLLNALDIPVFMIIGNHDLYHRHTRNIHSLIMYDELSNFKVIDSPTVLEDTLYPVLLCPFMFHDEYPSLKQYLDLKIWFGHFEFKGFEVTGAGMRMPIGPEAKEYIGPKFIFSGHFHKRQANEQIVYTGNCFPMDFGDAGDTHRGCMVFDYETASPLFYDWPDAPTYVNTRLSAILDKTVEYNTKSRIQCIVDIPLSFEEYTMLRDKFQENTHVREFVLIESPELSRAISDTDTEVQFDENTKLESVEELIMQMLNDVDTKIINQQLLLECYLNLKK